MLEFGLVAFSAFFATVAPVDTAAIFPAITAGVSAGRRRRMAVKGVLIAAAVLLVFTLAGNTLLELLGVTLPAVRIAGGILLLLMAIDMVFARHSGGISATVDEREEAQHQKDISVFPLATPLIAGPGAMGSAVLLAAEADGRAAYLAVVIAALASVLVITQVLLLIAAQLQTFLGITGLNVVTRVVGILLAALSVQFILDGLRGSGLFVA